MANAGAERTRRGAGCPKGVAASRTSCAKARVLFDRSVFRSSARVRKRSAGTLRFRGGGTPSAAIGWVADSADLAPPTWLVQAFDATSRLMTLSD